MQLPPSASARNYLGTGLNRIAFPLGGMGAGMICLEGTGAFTSVSLRHRPAIYHEPLLFSAISIAGARGGPRQARLLNGPTPDWKIVFPWNKQFESSGDGCRNKTYGLPHFDSAHFSAQFPFGLVELADPKVPLRIGVTGWSPFIPNDADNSSLPVAAIEYRFSNPTHVPVDAVYSFHAANFMRVGEKRTDFVSRLARGFVLNQPDFPNRPWDKGQFAAWIDEGEVSVNPAWFRGGWFDPMSMIWRTVTAGQLVDAPAFQEGNPSDGGSLYAPVHLEPGEEKTITLKWAWHVPYSDFTSGHAAAEKYRPWYVSAFPELELLINYWRNEYSSLRTRTEIFTRSLFDSTLPAEVLEAVGANLSILKSPTVLRQEDGRLWAWEGCHDDEGSCPGTCTHVWNYAQALPHLFPALERGLRDTEFFDSQDQRGHQNFRASLPIAPQADHTFHAAADGQLGGLIKVYRDWRISADLAWLKRLWPRIRASLDYCVETWDPEHEGALREPHHNTYDIEFWGPDGMCGSIYVGALAAAVEMGRALDENIEEYRTLLEKGRVYLEEKLFSGEYFQQKIQWQGLRSPEPTQVKSFGGEYSPESLVWLESEGPKYQYGTGCLSDGVIGAWFAWCAGLTGILDEQKVTRHLESVFRYNFREDLIDEANPQRPGYALGHEPGLLLCTWPHGKMPVLPMVYSSEVWTGIEYQVASHLISKGRVEEGLRIVRAVRARYDGRVRNPFNEYECGHWYARALASYALLQALSGARYDAVEKVLYLEPRVVGDFRSFLCTATGFGTVGIREGQPFFEVKSGTIDIRRIAYTR